MPKGSKRTNETAALKQRQVEGINRFLTGPRRNAPKDADKDAPVLDAKKTGTPKGKSLLDRRTLTDQNESALVNSKENDNSPRKRKRQKSPEPKEQQVQKKLTASPAKRRKQDSDRNEVVKVQVAAPCDTQPMLKNLPAVTREDLEPGSHQTVGDRDSIPSPPGEDAKVKTGLSKAIAMEPRPPQSPASAPAITQASSSYPSPASSKSGSSPPKRSITPEETESKDFARKKPRLDHVSPKPPKNTAKDPQTQILIPSIYPLRKDRAYTYAPIISNTNCEHNYADYDHDSIPLLLSARIQREPSSALLNYPSAQLKIAALNMLENPRGFTATELGRPDVPKKGRTKVINDVDLYLMSDEKIYIAAERGLILAADYLKLAGIADSTPVRFNGTKPPWVKASIAARYLRRIETSTHDPDAPDRENPFYDLPPGDLGLFKGFVVEVYERDYDTGRAYGRRTDNDKVGWFDYENVTVLHPPIEPWEGLFTPDIVVDAKVMAARKAQKLAFARLPEQVELVETLAPLAKKPQTAAAASPTPKRASGSVSTNIVQKAAPVTKTIANTLQGPAEQKQATSIDKTVTKTKESTQAPTKAKAKNDEVKAVSSSPKLDHQAGAGGIETKDQAEKSPPGVEVPMSVALKGDVQEAKSTKGENVTIVDRALSKKDIQEDEDTKKEEGVVAVQEPAKKDIQGEIGAVTAQDAPKDDVQQGKTTMEGQDSVATHEPPKEDKTTTAVATNTTPRNRIWFDPTVEDEVDWDDHEL